MPQYLTRPHRPVTTILLLAVIKIEVHDKVRSEEMGFTGPCSGKQCVTAKLLSTGTHSFLFHKASQLF